MSPIGRIVTVTIDRPRGSAHPNHPDLIYPIPYGFVPGTLAGDGMPQDAYVLGLDSPAESVEGVVVAVVERADDTESKWVVAVDGQWRDAQTIADAVAFQERLFDSRVRALPFRLAAIDMDATLLGPDHAISPENADALARLRALGVRIVLASGRRHENLIRFYERLGLDGPAISGNGALVRDTTDGDDWYARLLPAPRALEILTLGEARGVTQVVEHTDGRSYLKERTSWSDILAERTGNPLTEVGALPARGGENLRKILWIASPATVEAYRTELAARYGDSLYIQITDPEYLEFMDPDVNKAHALAVVAERLGVAWSEILAFGDGGNDIEMLQRAGCGVAMPHGWTSVRDAADRIAPAGPPESAFARGVEQLLDEWAPDEETLSVQVRGLAVGGAFAGRVVGPESSPRIGMTAFVPLAAPDETVRVRVRRAWTRHCEADLIAADPPSPARIAPACPHFGACGGCDLQHLPYELQLDTKREMLLSALKAAGLEPLAERVAPVVASPPYGYRQRITLHVDRDGAVGYFRRRTHDLLAVRTCPIAVAPLDAFVAEGFRIEGLPAGSDSTLLVEIGDNGLFGVLRTDAPASALDLPGLTALLSARFVGGAIVGDGKTAARFGEGSVVRTLDGQEVRGAPGGFAQANPTIDAALRAAVRTAAEGAQTAVDLYAGSGNFALALAAQGASVLAVESTRALTAAGRAEAKRRNLPVTFVDERVERWVRTRPKPVDLIVADPPRAGLDKVAGQLGFAPRLLLISCHLPSALRDWKALQKDGWRMVSVTPFDMFPQTAHLELLAVLERV